MVLVFFENCKSLQPGIILKGRKINNLGEKMRVEKQKFCSDALVKLQDEEINQASDLLASI